jgi:hypothetical protein
MTSVFNSCLMYDDRMLLLYLHRTVVFMHELASLVDKPTTYYYMWYCSRHRQHIVPHVRSAKSCVHAAVAALFAATVTTAVAESLVSDSDRHEFVSHCACLRFAAAPIAASAASLAWLPNRRERVPSSEL